MSVTNVHTKWGRLEEVWLGDVYPTHFYEHLESEIRDVFYEITEKTKEDLAVIHRKLEEFGVIVQRPQYNKFEDFVNTGGVLKGQLRKPSITPRDYFLVHGNRFFIPGGLTGSWPEWNHVLTEYDKDPNFRAINKIHLDTSFFAINGANAVSAGRDVYIDCFEPVQFDDMRLAEFKNKILPHFKGYRVHLMSNGGHIDGCFAAIKPGVLLTSSHFNDYERTFPGWTHISLRTPEFGQFAQRSSNSPHGNGKWFLPSDANYNNARFNDHIVKFAKDWVGDFTETYFEVNCLVVDEKNVLILGENEAVFRKLEEHGVTAHSMPFRNRTFWDGGLHCITTDIRRQDSAVDLFPERSEQPLFLLD